MHTFLGQVNKVIRRRCVSENKDISLCNIIIMSRQYDEEFELYFESYLRKMLPTQSKCSTWQSAFNCLITKHAPRENIFFAQVAIKGQLIKRYLLQIRFADRVRF